MDEASEEPLRNVELTTSPASDVVVSDNEGAFAFDGLEVGDYNLRARKSGYDTRSVSVAVRENRTSEVTLFMEEEEDGAQRELAAEVTSFVNREDDEGNTSVRVEYRIRNVGNGTIPEYEVTFRIETDDGEDRLRQVEGQLLREGQADVDEFEVDLDGADAVDVVVDEVWFEE